MKILVIGDMHVGGRTSIMPHRALNDSHDKKANEVHANELQKHMLNKWEDMCRQQFDICFLMGDLVEGKNKAEQGFGNWTNDVNVQIDCAVELLKMTGAKEFYGVQGSPYHSGLNGSADEDVVKALGGVFGDILTLNADGVRFHLKHVSPYSSSPYSRSTGLHKQMVTEQLESDMYGDVDVDLRAHTHYYHQISTTNGSGSEHVGMIVPCWKFPDGFLSRGNAITNDIGYVVFDVDRGQFNWNLSTMKIPAGIGIKEVTTGVY